MKVLALIFILIFCCSLVSAHSCATFSRYSDKEHSRELKKTTIIFYGEVTAITDNFVTSGNERSYTAYQSVTFNVLRSWKGVETDSVSALFASQNPCGVKLEIGRKYWIYSFDTKNPFEIDCCSFGLFDTDRIVKELGEGKIIEKHVTQAETKSELKEATEGFWDWLWRKAVSFFS